MQKTWDWLAEQPEDAAELAQLLFEATPRLGVAAAKSPRKATRNRRHPGDASLSLLDRLKAAEPLPSGTTLLAANVSLLVLPHAQALNTALALLWYIRADTKAVQRIMRGHACRSSHDETLFARQTHVFSASRDQHQALHQRLVQVCCKCVCFKSVTC